MVPIEDSLARIDTLLQHGAPETDEDGYAAWDNEYRKRTGGRYEHAPDWMAGQLSSWMSEHPECTVPKLLGDFGELERVTTELQQKDHMPKLFPHLDQAAFSEEWEALSGRVKHMKEALKDFHIAECDLASVNDSEGEETRNRASYNGSAKRASSHLSAFPTEL